MHKYLLGGIEINIFQWKHLYYVKGGRDINGCVSKQGLEHLVNGKMEISDFVYINFFCETPSGS
jgi:hypothetical protein